jgi:hypothetical protein
VAFDAALWSKKAKPTVEEARQSGEGVAISGITLLELAMLAHKKRIPLGLSLGSFLSVVESRFVVLPMNGHICDCSHRFGAGSFIGYRHWVRPTAKSVDRMRFPQSGESRQFSPTPSDLESLIFLFPRKSV